MQQGASAAVFGDPFLRGEVLRPSVEYGTRDLCALRAVSVAFRGDTLLVSRFEQEVQRRVAFVLHLLVEEVAQPVDYATARRDGTLECVGCMRSASGSRRLVLGWVYLLRGTVRPRSPRRG